MSYIQFTRDSMIFADGKRLVNLAKGKGVVPESYTLPDDRGPCTKLPEGSYSKNELVSEIIKAYTAERADAMAKNVALKSEIQRTSDEMASLKKINQAPLEEYYHLKRLMYEETPEREAAIARVKDIAATQLKEFFDRNGELFEAREKLRFELILVHDALAEIDVSWGIPRYLNVEY